MNLIHSIVLGLIQGLTEFLPISSSGHLEISKAIFGSDLLEEESLFLTLILHFGTALSTITVFRKEIYEIFRSLFEFKLNENTIFLFKLILSVFPAAFVGLLLQDKIEQLFSQNLILVGLMLLITAILLFLTDYAKDSKKKISFANAVILGTVQAIAILPGISRSGSTIAGAVLLGINREKAASFSFLMVLPLIFGSMVKILIDFNGIPQNTNLLSLSSGFVAAFVSGIFACKWMISLVKKSQLKYFGYYCILVGILSILYGLF